MAIDANGLLYGVNNQGYLYSVNLSTAEITQIGYTGCRKIAPSYPQSATFDRKTGKLYWAACFDATPFSALYELDTQTGAATKISNMPDGEELGALYVWTPEAESGAPARPENLNALFENGSLTGTVSFTLPTKTYDGGELGETVDYKLLVNGQVAAEGKDTPASVIEKELTLTEGNNKITVYCTNEAGDGAKANKTLYVGYDSPNSVTNLTAEKTNTGVMISWTSPEGSAHGGYLGSITYDIVRYPDNVAVASNIAEATFTDENLPEGQLKAYSYGVVAKNGSKTSDEVILNQLILGDAFTVPYEEDFLTKEAADLFTIIDTDQNGSSWYHYVYDDLINAMVISTSWGTTDWLISPIIHLEAGKTYTFTIRVNGNAKGYVETFNVAYGKGITAADMTNVLFDKESTNTNERTNHSVDFTPAETDDYNFGIQCVTDDGAMLHVDKITIVESVSTAVDVVDYDSTELNEAYNIAGQKLSAPEKGLNIVRTSRNVKKIIMK